MTRYKMLEETARMLARMRAELARIGETEAAKQIGTAYSAIETLLDDVDDASVIASPILRAYVASSVTR